MVARPLHGIPLLVKDNIVTQDELDASAGSYALLGAKPAVESSVIAKLRQAGVLILGKTNLSEWANFRGLNVSSGWSPRGGQTLGAYYLESQPDGSSAGSAVAAALSLCTAAIGTEVSMSWHPWCAYRDANVTARRSEASWPPPRGITSSVSSPAAASSATMVPSPSLLARMLSAPSRERSRTRHTWSARWLAAASETRALGTSRSANSRLHRVL